MESGLQKYKALMLAGHTLMEIYLGVREEQPSVRIRLLDLPTGQFIMMNKEEIMLMIGQLKMYTKSDIDYPYIVKKVVEIKIYVKLANCSNLYRISKNGVKMCLDEATVYRLVNLEKELYEYFSDIEQAAACK